LKSKYRHHRKAKEAEKRPKDRTGKASTAMKSSKTTKRDISKK
jgi:hypothetical protein